jgi:predicted HAD superfamily Cof-like phosphohydrolase
MTDMTDMGDGALTVSLGADATDEQIVAAADILPSMIRGLDYAFLQVRGFHKVMGQPAPSEPSLQPYEHAERRSDWIKDECDELTDPDRQTVVDQADAYLDIIYFALGGLVEIGVLPQALMDIVNGANMAKVQPDGTVHRRSDGKIIKPEGWVAPEPLLAQEVHRQAKHRLLSALDA